MYVGPGVAEAYTLAFLGPRNRGHWLEESTAHPVTSEWRKETW